MPAPRGDGGRHPAHLLPLPVNKKELDTCRTCPKLEAKTNLHKEVKGVAHVSDPILRHDPAE